MKVKNRHGEVNAAAAKKKKKKKRGHVTISVLTLPLLKTATLSLKP